MLAEVTAAWTRRTSTWGRPVSQVIARSASRRAACWTTSISFWSSASVIGWSGRLRSWLWVVVKPLTSSPAIPITTWVGRKPAISSASWRATEQLSTTAPMSATVPDCMCDRPCRLRPTPRTTPTPLGSISKTRALANSVPTSSAVQAAGAGSSARPQIRRRKVIRRPRPGPPRRPPPGRPGGRRPGRPVWNPCPGPSPAVKVAHRPLDQAAGRQATLDEVGRQGHEDLRLIGIEAQGDHAAGQQAAHVPGDTLHCLDRLERAAECDDRHARPDQGGARRQLGRLGDRPAGAGPRPPPGLLELVLERGDAIRQGLDRRGPGDAASALEQLQPVGDPGIGAIAGEGLDPTHARADAPLAGDHEAADLARGPAMGPAAQLVAVALDPDRAHRLAVLLVEERIGAGIDRLAHAHPGGGHRPVLADDPANLVLDPPALVVSQGPIEREVEAQAVGGDQRAGLPGAFAGDVAQGPVEEVGAGVVAH